MLNGKLMIAIFVVMLGVSCGGADPSPRVSDAPPWEVPALPTLEGPITGPGEMFVADVERAQPRSASDSGYVFEEFFVSGVAANNPYKVRLFVARPTDLNDFSGQVLVENNHAANRPLVWRYTRDYNLSRGHALVAVSTTTGSNITALRDFSPGRYADLDLEDAQVSDVYAQIGRLLRSDQTPLPGAEELYLTGFSMAAGPLPPFMSTHHEKLRTMDGGPVYDAFFLPPSRTVSRLGQLPDVDVPTIQMNSQLEVDAVYVDAAVDYRRPSSDAPGHQYRLYEVAGMPHIDSRYTPPGTGQGANHPGVDEPCDNRLNRFPNDRLLSTALDHLMRWVKESVPPPRIEPISVLGGAGGEVELDAHGNAIGGVRFTYVDVPVATHTASNTGPESVQCLVYGSQLPFSDATLADLYRDRNDYVTQVERRLDELVREGWLLEEYADEFRKEAAAFERIPLGSL